MGIFLLLWAQNTLQVDKNFASVISFDPHNSPVMEDRYYFLHFTNGYDKD